MIKTQEHSLHCFSLFVLKWHKPSMEYMHVHRVRLVDPHAAQEQMSRVKQLMCLLLFS